MAVGTYALTSLSNLKDWIGITSSTDDAILESAIDRATDVVEKYCDRKFKSRTYYEWSEPNGESTLTVRNTPIVSINAISYGSRSAMKITSDTGSTDVLATVANDGEEIRLRKVASDGTTTTSTISLSTYPTTALVVSYINASVSGWSATLLANAYSRSVYRFSGLSVIDADPIIAYTGTTASEFRVDFQTGEVHLITDRFPYSSPDGHEMHRFPRGFHPVFVEYDAGFATIPGDLELTTIEIAADLYRERKQDRTVGSESLGDYNYSRIAVAELLSARWEKLQAYREIR